MVGFKAKIQRFFSNYLSFASNGARKWAKMLFRTCPFQYRYHLLCVISALAIVFLVIASHIDFNDRIGRQYAQMCVKHSQIRLSPIACYLPICKSNTSSDERASFGDIILFEDVLESKRKPTPDRTIFFIVTSCTRLAVLSARQACAIESAARWNPQRDIFVLFASQVGLLHGKPSSPIMQSLGSYQNVHFRRINFRTFSMDTPAEEFFSTDTIFHSKYLIQTFSDVLRLITLYHFGGIYFDLDVIIQKNLDVLPNNFAGREISTYIANGVLGFSSDGFGHKLLELIINDVCANFKPKVWGNAGPQAITRMLKTICNVTEVIDMKPEICWGFQVLHEHVFYPIYGTKWERFFDASSTNESLKMSNQSLAVHFWNAYSVWQPILKYFRNQTLLKKYRQQLNRNIKILNPFGETAYGAIAKMNCPKSFNSSGDLF